MVIVSSFDLKNNVLTGIFTIIAKEIVICPLCGGELFYRDSRLRTLKDLFGKIQHFFLRRLRCQVCNKLHTELPSIIQPYKHYDSATIQSILDGNGDESACAADNSTIRRWKTEFANAEPGINQRLASLYAQTTDEKVPIASSINILDMTKIRTKHWLAFVMRLLINSGYKICTQFAFCPPSVSANVSSASKNATEGGKKDDQTFKNSS